MPLYVGFDSSTQSLTAIIIDSDTRKVVHAESLGFDEALPHYGTRHGVLPRAHPDEALASPLMWAEALDVMFGRLAKSGINLGKIAAISGSAQQHGSVYLNRTAAGTLGSLDSARPLAEQIAPLLSRAASPIWMDSSTAMECREITAAVGGAGPPGTHPGPTA